MENIYYCNINFGSVLMGFSFDLTSSYEILIRADVIYILIKKKHICVRQKFLKINHFPCMMNGFGASFFKRPQCADVMVEAVNLMDSVMIQEIGII
jgi:hypothetical protein